MLVGSALLLVALLLSATSRVEADECAASGTLPEGATFIGYSRPDESALNSAALLTAKTLEGYDGRNLTVGLVLHQAGTDNPARTELKSVAPYLERVGPNHCEYPAQLTAPKSKQWRIWSSEPLNFMRQPTESERLAFRALLPECVQQGDPPPGEETCTHAALLAVSDIDSDGSPEYWHSTPYRWDTGLTVSKLVDSSSLEVIVSACPGCSD